MLRRAGCFRLGAVLSSLALSALALSAVLATPMRALAAEHVTLRNGFDLLCDHSEPVGSRVRLFTAPHSGNFVEVNAAEIVAVEPAPDPPAPPAPQTATASTTPSAEPTPAAMREILAKAGAQQNLDIELLASVIRAESGGRVRAVSRTGAQGLMQLMPGTAAELGVRDSFAADQNVNGGTAYLNALLARYHDNLPLALAAYNAGPAAVDKYRGIPPYRETRAYVARVIHEFNRRKALARQAPHNQQSAALAAPLAQHAPATP